MNEEQTSEQDQATERSEGACSLERRVSRRGWTVEDQSKNGVRVKVHRNKDGSYVDADCSCLGMFGRTHDNTECPVYKAANK